MYSGEKTVEELKREWKKTKKEEIGVMYVNKLIAMNEYELAKKITLELKKYTKNKIDIYTTLGKIELYMGNIKEAKYQLRKIDNIYIRNTSFTVLARVYLAEKEYDKAKELLKNKNISYEIKQNQIKISIPKEEIPKYNKLFVKEKIDVYQIRKDIKSLEDEFIEKTKGTKGQIK